MAILFRKTQKLLLLAGDILLLYLSLWLTLVLRQDWTTLPHAWEQHALPFSFLYIIWIFVFFLFGLYDLNTAQNTLHFQRALSKAFLFNALFAIMLFYFIPAFGIAPKTNLFVHLLIAAALIILWRHFFNILLQRSFFTEHLVVIGRDQHTSELDNLFRSNPQLGYSISTFLDPERNHPAELLALSRTHTILAPKTLSQYPPYIQTLFSNIGRFHVENFTSFYERVTGKVPLSQIDEVWFFSNLQEREKYLYEMFKRAIDICVALALALALFMLLPLIALFLWTETKGPIFYSQKRVGKNGSIFSIWKLRSMKPDAENGNAQWAAKDDPRITKVGKVLRKTFLDEFPQCFNILKGEMSFIGPRPERPEFVKDLEKQIPFYQIRHIVKPGITGWAQVNFPYGNTQEAAREKLQYELYYIKHRSPILDAQIFFRTFHIIRAGGNQTEQF